MHFPVTIAAKNKGVLVRIASSFMPFIYTMDIEEIVIVFSTEKTAASLLAAFLVDEYGFSRH